MCFHREVTSFVEEISLQSSVSVGQYLSYALGVLAEYSILRFRYSGDPPIPLYIHDHLSKYPGKYIE